MNRVQGPFLRGAPATTPPRAPSIRRRCSTGSPAIAPSPRAVLGSRLRQRPGHARPRCALRARARHRSQCRADRAGAAPSANADFARRAGRTLQPAGCQRRCGLRGAGAALVRPPRVLRRVRARAEAGRRAGGLGLPGHRACRRRSQRPTPRCRRRSARTGRPSAPIVDAAYAGFDWPFPRIDAPAFELTRRSGRCRACSPTSPAIRPASATARRPAAMPWPTLAASVRRCVGRLRRRCALRWPLFVHAAGRPPDCSPD